MRKSNAFFLMAYCDTTNAAAGSSPPGCVVNLLLDDSLQHFTKTPLTREMCWLWVAVMQGQSQHHLGQEHP
jgi:hypothetical protein